MRGRKPILSEAQRREVANAVRRGVGQGAIAQEFGVSQSTVSRIAGEYETDAANGGELIKALSAASDDAKQWIFSQIPEGATLADYLVEVALDLYFEQEGKAA